MKCRNKGAPIPRKDGTVIGRGQLFDATAEEWGRLRYKLVAVEGTEEAPPKRPAAAAAGWTRSMSPEIYLQLYPDGPYAEDARRIIQAEGEKKADTTTGES